MIAFAPCKINLGLYITSRRPDGFHNLQSVFYPVHWHDSVEIEIVQDAAVPVELVEYGIKAGGNAAENLCCRAYTLLAKHHAVRPVKIHLYKTIPTGAGLGGGSADASATLLLLNRIFNLNLGITALENYAAQLGSDCPFFIHRRPMLVRGRGENLAPLDLDLSAYYMLLVNPALHISTAAAYALISPREMEFNLAERLQQSPVSAWKDFLINDFEKPVFGQFPQLPLIKQQLYDHGAVYAAMSGSGSTLFGLYDKLENAQAAQKLFAAYTTKLVMANSYMENFV